MINLATTGVITYSTSVIPEEELTKSSPEVFAKQVKSCSVQLFNAKNQSYEPEQKINYTPSGKVEQFTALNHPQEISRHYIYDNDKCVLYAYIVGKDTLAKENSTYYNNARIIGKQITYYNQPPKEPTQLTQEYRYDSNDLLIEKKTITPKHKLVSRTSYTYSGKEHISTESYDKYNKVISETLFTCDSTLLLSRHFPQNRLSICKTFSQTDSTIIVKKGYYHPHKWSNYTTEAVFSSKDTMLYSLTVTESNKEYVATHTYNDQRNITESIITINGKQESRKVYVYDPSGLLLIKSEEYGPKNQLYGRYKFEYEFF